MMIKNLTKNVVKKGLGFNLREDLNFRDDGNSFKGFDYKGLPITTLRTCGETYLSIRVDYLDNDFTWYEWHDTVEAKLCDEFNGVSEIDLDKLIENCERVIKKVAELNEEVNRKEIDMKPIEERIAEEILIAKNVINEARMMDWWKLDEWELRNAKRYMNHLEEDVDKLMTMDFEKLSRKRKSDMAESLKRYGYVEIREDGFYVETLREYIAECEK